MRIALVSRELYPYIGGGIAPIVAAAARQLSEIAEVTVVTSTDHREEHERMRAVADPRLLPESIRFEWVDEPGEECGSTYTYMHAYSLRVHAALKHAYGDRGPDLIEFPDYLGEGFVTMQDRHTGAAWLRDTLVCVRLHTTSEIVAVLDGRVPDDNATVALFDAERYALRHADRVLWSGGDVLATYERFYSADQLAPAVKIPDAFLAEGGASHATPREPLGAEGGRPMRLLYLGRMERRKGVRDLVRALIGLGREDWRLTLLGGDTHSGPVGTSVRDLLRLAAAEDERITFAESVARRDVDTVIADHDVLVVPSLWECWPNVGREALAQNRPLLATPVGGLTAMATPGAGWLTHGTGPEHLARGLHDLLDRRAEVDAVIESGAPAARFAALADAGTLRGAYSALIDAGRDAAPARPARPGRRVSVVVPYWRLDRYVGETLDSVAAQTHDDIEVVVVVDGSLREEDRVALDFADRDGVRVVVQPNAGLGAARNFGISQAKGDYVLPLDADDRLEPTFVARCVQALEDNPSLAYATAWSQYMKHDGTRIPDELGGYMPYGNWSRLIDRTNLAGPCTAVFRRRVFERGFRYSVDLVSYEDWLLYWELHENGLYGAVVPERLFRYRLRDESMLRRDGAPAVETILEEMRAQLRERTTRWTATTA